MPDGPLVEAVPAGQKTNGPGDCGEVALQVAVMPNTTTFRDVASRLSPAATVPLSGPVETSLPAGIAGLELPLNSVVPEPFLVSVSVEVTEFAPTSIGEVIAEVERLMVAAVPSWVAVSVAVPEP